MSFDVTRARADTPYKKYKLTEEDLRNREKWPLYEEAVHDMVTRTSSELAPWHLVPAMDKRFARCYELGCNSYLIKPLEADRYRDALQEIYAYWFQVVCTPPR